MWEVLGMTMPLVRSLDKALTLLSALGDGAQSLPELARVTGYPLATVHRLVATLEQRGFIVRAGRGALLVGPVLLGLARRFDGHAHVASLARPVVAALARRAGALAQLGVLEGDMVTYLVKEGRAREALFSREGMQLEAYCSALGKVLLAGQSEVERARYLAGGPFVALTPRTIVDPAALATEFERTAARGYATDEGEIDAGLACLAVPVCNGDGRTVAALSLSSRGPVRRPQEARLALLREAANAISARFTTHSLHEAAQLAQ